ncbi:helix-turn-helix domain-containing protein [Streptosporangium carneum]|uniref:Transcriptional regulator n=1 Tax=Streptosporangium carneum TaxID=47481 RepID=A0A9W6I8K1_9ACTN|nr:helix-turn-helix transcriptional regulator [Streptosporangium carneum]GLK13154.1 transcriptional regulator [Streptosporangium carneum]
MTNDFDPRLTPIERFGRELARVRREAGLSQARLGAHLGVSSSLVGHIEIGNRTPQSGFAALCDEVFKTGDLFARLCRNITAPSGPLWFIRWSDEIEPRARVLRSWDPLLVPGLLQTESYARHVFRGGLAASEQEVEELVNVRMRRQTVLQRENPPALWVLLDEWVLRRPVGGPEVMYEQLDHLVAIAGRHNVKLQLVPHDSPCTSGLLSAFALAELSDAPTTVSVESAGAGEVSAAHDLVNTVWNRYDRIRTEAFRPGQSLEMIKKARSQWKMA